VDKKKIEEIQAKLLEINEVITKLDPAIRGVAFEMLAPYYIGDNTKPRETGSGGPPRKDTSSGEMVNTNDLSSFIESSGHGKPNENLMMLVAWLYSQYGSYPIQSKEIEDLSDTSGLVIPSRPDNTKRYAKEKGKNLFTQQGKGWKLTVSGEIFLKNKYNVKKGSKPLPKE